MMIVVLMISRFDSTKDTFLRLEWEHMGLKSTLRMLA